MRTLLRYRSLRTKQHLPFIVFIAAIIFAPGAGLAEPDKYFYVDDQFKVEYEMVNGMYNGSYKSWYTNGNKRSEGSFLSNMRSGKWTVYDSTGRMRMQRVYRNNFEFQTIYPPIPKGGPAVLFSEPIYKPEYNALGFITYFHLEERAVAVSKRIWRYVPNDSGQLLFSNHKFYPALLDSISKAKVKVYAAADGFQEFRNILADSAMAKLLDSAHYTLLGFRLIEDWFFDKDRMMSESRILGLCPVVRFEDQSDSTDLGWIYLPTIRRTLAVHKVAGTKPVYINTLDDVLFFRCFRSWVYRESRLYDRSNREAAWAFNQRVETNLIELEHDQWIFFTR